MEFGRGRGRETEGGAGSTAWGYIHGDSARCAVTGRLDVERLALCFVEGDIYRTLARVTRGPTRLCAARYLRARTRSSTVSAILQAPPSATQAEGRGEGDSREILPLAAITRVDSPRAKAVGGGSLSTRACVASAFAATTRLRRPGLLPANGRYCSPYYRCRRGGSFQGETGARGGAGSLSRTSRVE